MRYLAALLAFVALPAFAATLNWTHPTQGVQDGNTVPIAVNQVASSTIEWSNGTTFGAVAGSQVVTGTANTAVAPSASPGSTRCYRVRTTLIASVGGQTSAPSNAVCLATPAGPITPNPPSLIEVILAWLRSIFSRFA